MEQHVGDPAVLLADHRLGRGLGFGIRPFGRDRRLLVDALAGLAGRVHQHGARVDELADLEVLEGPQQAAGALDVDLVVERMVLAGEIEIGSEVHDAGDAAAVALAEFSERKLDRIARAQVDLDAVDRRPAAVEIEADHRVGGLERAGERRADRAGNAGDDDDRLFGLAVHDAGLPRASATVARVNGWPQRRFPRPGCALPPALEQALDLEAPFGPARSATKD